MSRALTVLNVAYPLAPVRPATAGGAEQVLGAIDRGLVDAGHRSIVIACEGSEARGELVATAAPEAVLDDAAHQRAIVEYRRTIAQTVANTTVDLVHLHGIDFLEYLPAPGPPVLVTLHLPPSWYPEAAFRLDRPRTFVNCVSRSQLEACPPGMRNAVGVIENGVDVEDLRPEPGDHPRTLVMGLGRICPEKAHHRALWAARRAGLPMLLAGEVHGYPAHRRYFAESIEPSLDAERRFVGGIGPGLKRALLASARCLVVPSEVAETSSLVAMEALACGTPVVTFGAGALREVVEHGRTGLIVDADEAMAEALIAVTSIDRGTCRRVAEERFSAARMVADYLRLYEHIVRCVRPARGPFIGETGRGIDWPDTSARGSEHRTKRGRWRDGPGEGDGARRPTRGASRRAPIR